MTKLIRGMLLVFLMFGKYGTGDKHVTLQCGPQNLQLSNVGQDLQITWESHPSCSSLKSLVFKLIVLVEDKQVHHEEVVVMADDIGTSHWWSWTSFLPLECASHSVKIRSRYENQTSPWTTETLPGLDPSAKIQVFPQDQVFEVGSRVTFCCIIPMGKTFKKMSVSNYKDAPSNTSTLNNHTYALTVDLLWPTLVSDADIKCETEMDEDGACAVIGYHPSDSNLTCETRDFISAECFWTVGPQIFLKPTDYWLLEQSCSNQPKGKCSQKVELDAGERNWTLIARNRLGTTELIDEADLTKRVYMYTPKNVTIFRVNAKNASLRWFWTVPRYSLLNLTCQINTTNEASTIIEKNGIGLRSVVLNDLIPNWTYTVTVRCATASDFWKWGDWSRATTFDTKGDIPSALDVWMHKEGKQTLITWKLLENHQSHGPIIDYEVTWTDSEARERNNTLCVVHPINSIALNLSSSKKYVVKVTARNAYGSSTPSQIIISTQSRDTPRCNTSRISGIGGGFNLSWAASSNASCGYIVDWCSMSGDCSVDWLKVPPDKTSATIYSKNFKDGVRYKLSVYICTADAPVLLEMREGYVNEQRIPDVLFKNLRWEQHGSDVKISWDKISLTEQSAFIEGYILYFTNENIPLVSTGDPEVSSLTAQNLHIATYTFSVYALTSFGECGLTKLSATVNSQTDNLVSAFLIALVTTLTLLLVLAVVCYRHWACIKQKIYPPIPEPVLMGKWLPSKDLVPYCPSEELAMAVPELHCKFPSSEDGYICQKDKGITYTTLAQNQALKKHVPCEVILPPTSSLMRSSFNVFPNPIYNLVFLGNSAQTGLETEDFEEEIFKNYQPQDFIQKERDADSISCVSAYIVLP